MTPINRGHARSHTLKQGLKRVLPRLVGRRVYAFIYAAAWTGRMWRGRDVEEEQRLLPRFVRPGDTCIDIGAHAGDYTARLASLVGPEGHVHAFEASPFYAHILNLALRLNRISNVTVHASAVGGECGTQGFVETDRNGRFLHGYQHLAGEAEEATTTVPVVTLDAIAPNLGITATTRFIKCDVEGAELGVLRGASQLLQTSRPIVQCEVNSQHLARYGHTPREVFDLMASLDYEALELGPDGDLHPVRDIVQRRENVLFMPNTGTGTT